MAAAEISLSEQQLLVGTEWVVSGRVRLRRRIVTEVRTVEVTVRREVLELSGDTVDFRDGRLIGVDLGGPRVAPPTEPVPFVAVLREEVPVVTMQTRPYEQVVATTTLFRTGETVHDTVLREQAAVDLEPAAAPNPSV